MGFLLFSDPFTRTGAIGSDYRETGVISFECTGTRLRLPDTATAHQFAGGTGYYAAAARAIANNADPKSFLPLTSFRSAAPVTPTCRVRYQVRLEMPETLPSPSDELWAGLVFLAPDQPNQGGYELHYWIDSSGNHYLRAGTRNAGGAFFEHAPARRDLTAAGTALAAGEEATLFAEVVFSNMWVFDIRTWWDPQGGTSTNGVDALHLWRGITWPVVPTAAIPPASPSGIGPDSAEFYGGVIAYQEGPASSGTSSTTNPFSGTTSPGTTRPPLLTSRLTLDDFRIQDARSFSGQVMHPVPEAAPVLTRTAATVPSEGNASGSSLSVQPSFSLPVTEDWGTRQLPHDDGTVESFPTRSRPRRIWAMTWRPMLKRERDLLRADLLASEGTVKDFTWTHPTTGEVIQLRPVEPPRFTQVGGSAWSCEGRFEEVF